MNQKNSLFRSPAAISIFTLILTGWLISTQYFGLPLFASQKSLRLPQLGAATGDIFITHEWWRLLVSQFLHVHFLHMLFNAMCILILASTMERKYGWRVLLGIYLIGGLTGQAASVWAYPLLVTDGASQALMALCAATFVLLPKSKLIWFAGLIVAIQVALDVHVIAGIKAGHLYGFIGGLLISLGIWFMSRSKGKFTKQTDLT